MGRLAGKTALVTGAASGIGRAVARRFAAAGATVILADIARGAGVMAAAEIGAGARFVSLDVTSVQQWQRALDGIDGALDILVNAAGIYHEGDFLSCSLQDWQLTMQVNAGGVFLGCQAAIRKMVATGTSGSIVNIGSIYGVIAADDVVAYAASKGAVRQLTRAVALYCAGKRIPVRCNAIHPGYADTPMLDGFAEAVGGHAAMVQGLTSVVPMRRMVEAGDVAEAALFLASDAARMTTGGEIAVDGGMLAGIIAPVSWPESEAEGENV